MFLLDVCVNYFHENVAFQSELIGAGRPFVSSYLFFFFFFLILLVKLVGWLIVFVHDDVGVGGFVGWWASVSNMSDDYCSVFIPIHVCFFTGHLYKLITICF